MLLSKVKNSDGWDRRDTIIQVRKQCFGQFYFLLLFVQTQINAHAILCVAGFKKLLRNRGYDGEISLLIDPTSTHNPLKGPACLENCEICTPIEVKHTTPASHRTQTDKTPQINEPVTVIESNTTETLSDKCNDNNNEQDEHDHVSANSHMKNDAQITNNIHIIPDIHVECIKIPIDSSNDKAEQHFVKTINGKFFMVNGVNISCACPRSPNGFSKYCHLCDGYIDLILVRHTTFLNNLRFLLAMSSRNCRIVCVFFLL